MGNKRLSILVCSLNKRIHLLKRLLDTLRPQINDSVELLVESDNGEIPIGRKRNILLDKANGDYIAYVDDDDLVSNDYVSKILNAISSNPDCCGIEGIITFDGHHPRKFIHSVKYSKWFESKGIYYRCPNHLSPIRRELALRVKFPELDQQEDRSYSFNIFPLLKNEVYIDGPIYFYLFSQSNSESIKKDNKNQKELAIKLAAKLQNTELYKSTLLKDFYLGSTLEIGQLNAGKAIFNINNSSICFLNGNISFDGQLFPDKTNLISCIQPSTPFVFEIIHINNELLIMINSKIANKVSCSEEKFEVNFKIENPYFKIINFTTR